MLPVGTTVIHQIIFDMKKREMKLNYSGTGGCTTAASTDVAYIALIVPTVSCAKLGPHHRHRVDLVTVLLTRCSRPLNVSGVAV